MLENQGFNRHTKGVFKLLTSQLNAHIKEVSEKPELIECEIHSFN